MMFADVFLCHWSVNTAIRKNNTMIQVYTGNGKGKTTAAIGLAVRAAGAGLKVYIGQFCKGRDYSELHALKKIKNIKIEQLGAPCFIKRKPSAKDFAIAKKGFSRIKNIIARKYYDMVILDELSVAVKLGLIKVDEVIGLLKKPSNMKEIIITGRCAPKEVIKLADLASEIREIKHYYKKDIKARKGIEF